MRFVRWFLLAALVTSASPVALADSSSSTLTRQLATGDDFRVRVKAALELGKTHDPSARVPLEKALDDPSAPVRAAAAAALRVLGDDRAIPALKRHLRDRNDSVRAQVRATIDTLEQKAERRAEQPRYLVKLGRFSIAEEKHRPVLPTMARASREGLDDLPGVLVLDDWEDPDAASQSFSAPVVMVSGRLRNVAVERVGTAVVYRAEVEYVIATMPEKNIVGMISGAASARAPVTEAANPRRMVALRNEVVTAAVDSAMGRVSPAIEAAAR